MHKRRRNSKGSCESSFENPHFSKKEGVHKRWRNLKEPLLSSSFRVLACSRQAPQQTNQLEGPSPKDVDRLSVGVFVGSQIEPAGPIRKAATCHLSHPPLGSGCAAWLGVSAGRWLALAGAIAPPFDVQEGWSTRVVEQFLDL